jgi:hypothetical protein
MEKKLENEKTNISVLKKWETPVFCGLGNKNTQGKPTFQTTEATAPTSSAIFGPS